MGTRRRDTAKREAGVPMRTRARDALRVLNTSFGISTGHNWAIDPKSPGSGEMSARMRLDAPSHSRLPDADLEIIDVAKQIGTISEPQTVLVTGDIGMDLRARSAGVRTHNITLDPATDVD